MRYNSIMQSKSGFTIVELLVVVVVMGILSAVALVAFNGIQQQARESQLLAGIDALEKGLRMYEFKNGHFPDLTDVVPGDDFTAACVQPTAGGWPATEGLTSSQCYNLSSGGEIGYSTVLRDALLTVTSGIPDTSGMVSSIPGLLSARGIIYQYWSEDRVGLVYFIPSDKTCGRGKVNINLGSLLQCFVELRGV